MTGQVKIIGILSVLALLFKHGKREDLVGYGKSGVDERSWKSIKKMTRVCHIALALIKVCHGVEWLQMGNSRWYFR